MSSFIGKPVAVEWVQEIGWKHPVSFVYRQTSYQVELVEERWEEHGFPASGPRRPRWYHRRHRVYYRVLTGCGRRFILCYDRGGKLHSWVLLKEI